MNQKIKLVFGIIGVLIASVSALLIIVDGVAIIFTYISLVFALLSIGVGNNKIIKTYWAIFVMAHLIFGWRVYSDKTNYSDSRVNSPVGFKKFERCSNEMFEGINKAQHELTRKQKEEFELCMNQ